MKNVVYTDPTGIQVFTVDDILTSEECKELIEFTEKEGFKSAPITTRRGFVHNPGFRNNGRVVEDSPIRAKWLFDKVKEYLPEDSHGWKLVGLNERFRYYRYEEGQYFKWHFDGAYHRSPTEASHLTLMVYLNEGCEGGATEFDGLDEEGRIKPKTGKMLIFDHPILHQGAPLISGHKYVLRTDVMYAKA